MLLVVNIKENSPTVEEALANFELELENAKLQNAKILKVIHGYGSSGVGGAILRKLKQTLPHLKRTNQIKDYFSGATFDIANPKVLALAKKVPDLLYDEDISHQNIGVTFIVLDN
ncbi:MAG: Smr/MutS family protein [Clostridia bacterium]|nr:Smr/MutS family protein [Clostridia bacterium]